MGLWSSKSVTQQAVTNNNLQANATGGDDSRNVSAHDSNVNLYDLDGDTVGRAFDALETLSANADAGFARLLDASAGMLKQSTETAAGAYTQAAADMKGGMDQKTMLMLAALAVVAIVFLNKK